MPYMFTCPHCQTKTEVEDRYSGQTGQCVTCGGAIQLPEFAGRPSTAAPVAKASTIRWILASIVAVILIGCLAFAAIRIGGETMTRLTVGRERASSIKNLEKIAKALNNYAADHGAYPPPVTRDAAGKPLHSWRVLILPYLDEVDLYDQIRLDLPWDDPNNMTVAYEMPSVYRHPGGGSGRFNESAYYLIVGRGTLFPTTGPLDPNQVVDDPAQTILVIEGTPMVPSGMWTEPIDFEFAKMSGQIAANQGIDPGGLTTGGVATATVDGRGHFIPDSKDPMIFRALITPSGGERLDDDELDQLN